MTKDEALERKAENARELGLNYEPEPVAWLTEKRYAQLHTAQRTWVGLTDEEKDGKRVFENGLLFNTAEVQVWELAVQWAEEKLRSKNT